MISLVASIVDRNGTVKHLNNEIIKFEIKGEGSIVEDSQIMANPVKVEWGTAPIIVRSTTKPGEITIRATVLDEGTNSPSYGEITFTSIPVTTPLLFNEKPSEAVSLPISNHINNNPENNSEQALKRRV
jgi:beta-galactosidase